MPYKKINFELQQGTHNSPDSFILKYGKITLYSDSLFLTPRVQITHMRSVKVHEIVLGWTRKYQISIEGCIELEDIITDFVDYFFLSQKLRKELFKAYRETQLVKLNHAIDGLKEASQYLWNDNVKLPDIYFKIESTLKVYVIVKDNLEKRKTGKHQLLYDLLMPLLGKLRQYRYTDPKIKELINDLLPRFDYDFPDIGRELLKYEKKEYFPDKVIKQIQNFINN